MRHQSFKLFPLLFVSGVILLNICENAYNESDKSVIFFNRQLFSILCKNLRGEQVKLRKTPHTNPTPPGQVYLSLFEVTLDDEIVYGSFKQQNKVN